MKDTIWVRDVFIFNFYLSSRKSWFYLLINENKNVLKMLNTKQWVFKLFSRSAVAKRLRFQRKLGAQPLSGCVFKLKLGA